MEQGEASGSNPHLDLRYKIDEQGVDGKGPDMESLADDFKSLLIGDEEKPKHYDYYYGPLMWYCVLINRCHRVSVPSNSKYSDVELLEIHSDIEVSSFEKQGYCTITRNLTMQNKSSTVDFADGTDVPTEDTIISGPVSDGYLSYRFNMMPINESSKKVFKISLDSEHVKCGICLNIWHDAVTVAPCLHNFCKGCFSGWLRRTQKKHASVLCPRCISDVQFVKRNHFLHRIEEEIRQSESYLRRGDEELAIGNSNALIKSLPVINYQKKPRSKRSRKCSMPEEDNYGADLSCAQCGTEYGGFQCNQNTVHLPCHACGGMMPSRTNIHVSQHCMGCDRAFCGAYHMCALKPIGERSITKIPFLAHEWNRHEQEITERCIQQMGKTLQDVVYEWVTKLDNREIDLTRMPLNFGEMINSETHICNECYDHLVSFFLYRFRICLPKNHLPQDAAQREDCWYGYSCRTQKHNGDHARKRNHVCPPTKRDIEN